MVLKERTVYSNSISDKETFWYFNIMYAFALVATATIAIVSQVYVQSQLTNQLESGKLINMAGRQRMLSQRITKCCLELRLREGNQAEGIEELKSTLADWKSIHLSLTERGDSISFNFNNSELIGRMYEVIESPYEEITEQAASLLQFYEEGKNDSVWEREKIRLLLDNESFYLRGMDAIVLQFEEEAREKVAYLKQVELLSLMLILVTLLLEVLIIFHPTARRIQRIIQSLVQSEQHAQEISTKLTELNVSLDKSNKEVKDINFALDEATILIRTNEFGIITYANEKYCQITKYEQRQLIGKKLFQNHHSREESIIYDHINDPQQGTNTWRGEICDHAQDDSLFWLDVTLLPIVSQEGVLYQYLIICSNITKRKQTELKLAQFNEEKLQRQRDEQKQTSYAIISGQEKERKRMSQEIHDGIGQMLTALKFGVEAIPAKDDKSDKLLQDLKGQLHDIIREIRRISSDLLPSVLDDFGLVAALRDLVKTVGYSHTGIELLEEPGIEKIHVNKTVEIGVYRVVQEAVNNSLKYSDASEIKIKLSSDFEFLHVSVEDNGRGFDIKKAMIDSKSTKSGNGLANMHERAELINGQLAIISTKGKGTVVSLQIPIEQEVYGED